jgi:hypothetical protein
MAFKGDLFEPNSAPECDSEASAFVNCIQGHKLFVSRAFQPNSMEVIKLALQSDAVARRIMAKGLSPMLGESVGVRLNINVLNHTGVAVHSIHRATSKDGLGHTRGRGYFRGEVISYLPVVLLKDAYFNVHQGGREAIASGRMAKHPMGSIDGTFVSQCQEMCFDGIEISFNPMSTHLFVDSQLDAVQFAQEVVILGHRAYARGKVQYFTEATAPKKIGASPSLAKLRS